MGLEKKPRRAHAVLDKGFYRSFASHDFVQTKKKDHLAREGTRSCARSPSGPPPWARGWRRETARRPGGTGPRPQRGGALSKKKVIRFIAPLGFQLSSSWKWERKEQVHLSSICLAHRPCFLSPSRNKEEDGNAYPLCCCFLFLSRKVSLSFPFSLGTLLLRWSCGGRVSESWWKFVGKESFCSAKKSCVPSQKEDRRRGV